MSPEKASVAFDTSDFKGTPSRHVVFTDIWQREEYALFQGHGAQSEIIFSAADERNTIILLFDMTVPREVKTWNIARNHPISWGAKGLLGTPIGVYAYQQFRLTDVGRNCVGFSTEWDRRQDDPDTRPSKVLFGYYCGRPGGPALTNAHVINLIDSIDLQGITTRRYVRFTPIPPTGQKATQPGARAFARGETPDTGNSKFPFNMAFMFQEPTGEDDKIPN